MTFLSNTNCTLKDNFQNTIQPWSAAPSRTVISQPRCSERRVCVGPVWHQDRTRSREQPWERCSSPCTKAGCLANCQHGGADILIIPLIQTCCSPRASSLPPHSVDLQHRSSPQRSLFASAQTETQLALFETTVKAKQIVLQALSGGRSAERGTGSRDVRPGDMARSARGYLTADKATL